MSGLLAASLPHMAQHGHSTVLDGFIDVTLTDLRLDEARVDSR
jgi:hypothetical protein